MKKIIQLIIMIIFITSTTLVFAQGPWGAKKNQNRNNSRSGNSIYGTGSQPGSSLLGTGSSRPGNPLIINDGSRRDKDNDGIVDRYDRDLNNNGIISPYDKKDPYNSNKKRNW